MTEEERRRRITDLLSAYVHCIDDDRLEEWPSFFTFDCIYRITSRDNHQRGLPVGIFFCENRNMLLDRVSALRQANIYEPHHYRHVTGDLRFLESDNGVHVVHSNYQVMRIMQNGETSLFSTGKYMDRVVFEDGQALFKERVVLMDSHRIDTLLAFPL